MSSQFTNDPLNDWDNNDNDTGGSGGFGILLLLILGVTVYFLMKG